MGFLSISLLGGFDVTMDNQPVDEFEYNKVRGLFAFLAVENKKPHHRETIAELFWPERPAQSARNSLRQAISILRNLTKDREAEIPFYIVGRDYIQFNSKSNHWLDVATFLDSIQACRESLKRGDKPGRFCIHWLNQALRLYKGDFLHQFRLHDSEPFENWVIQKRNEYRRYILEAMDVIAAHSEEQGDFHESIITSRKQIELDPLREEAHRRLMRMYFILGSRSEMIAQYEQCKAVLSKELGVPPEEETRILYEKLLRIDSSEEAAGSGESAFNSSDPLIRGNFLAFLNDSDMQSVTGREQELSRLSDLLRSEEKSIISITGNPGTGKTSLMRKAACENSHLFSDGIYYIDFSRYPESTPPSVVICEGTGLPSGHPSDPDLYLINFIKKRKILYLLDNPWETRRNAELLARILDRAPGVKIITASETVSQMLPHVCEIRLQGLRYPDNTDSGQQPESYPSVVFFTKCARKFLPDFQLNERNRNQVTEICTLLKGEPLALELAASWLRMLSLPDICRELKSCFMQNSGKTETGAVLDVTWNLLTEQEMNSFRKLCVFTGGFTRHAAEKVCDASLPVLSSLTGKGLLYIDFSGRYNIREAIRKSVLIPYPEAEELQAKHSDYYLLFLFECEEGLCGASQKQILENIGSELLNIRKAWDYAISRSDLTGIERACRAFALFLDSTGRFEEGRYRFETAVHELSSQVVAGHRGETLLNESILAKLRSLYSWFLLRLHHYEDAGKEIRRSMETLDQLKTMPSSGKALPLLVQGVWYYRKNRFREAQAALEKSLGLYMRSSNTWFAGVTLRILGNNAFRSGDSVRAMQYYKDALRFASDSGEKRLMAAVLADYAQLSETKAEYSRAELQLRESAELLDETDDRIGYGNCLLKLSGIYLKRGDLENGKKILKKAKDIFRDYNDLYGLTKAVILSGRFEAESGSVSAALSDYSQGLLLARDIQSVTQIIEAMYGIALLTDLQGDPEKACIYMHHIVILAETNQKKQAAEYRRYLNELEQGFEPDKRAEIAEMSSSISVNEVIARMLQNASGSSYPNESRVLTTGRKAATDLYNS